MTVQVGILTGTFYGELFFFRILSVETQRGKMASDLHPFCLQIKYQYFQIK
jgi:hypothetical protein